MSGSSSHHLGESARTRSAARAQLTAPPRYEVVLRRDRAPCCCSLAAREVSAVAASKQRADSPQLAVRGRGPGGGLVEDVHDLAEPAKERSGPAPRSIPITRRRGAAVRSRRRGQSPAACTQLWIGLWSLETRLGHASAVGAEGLGAALAGRCAPPAAPARWPGAGEFRWRRRAALNTSTKSASGSPPARWSARAASIPTQQPMLASRLPNMRVDACPGR